MSQSSTQFDVCIRGAGIVGRSLSLMLASQGLRVALVNLSDAQKSAHGHSDVRAYSLNSASQQLLTDLRCWPEGTACTPILKMHIEGDQGGNLEFSAAQQDVEALNWMIDVPTLENNLAKSIGFQPLIQEVAENVKAPLTVICEGRASQTRAELGVAFDVKHYEQHALACRIQTQAPHQQIARQWFHTAHGPEILAFLPIGGEDSHEWAVVWSLTPTRTEQLRSNKAASFCAQLQEASNGVAGSIELISERAVWPLQLAKAARWTGSMPHSESGHRATSFALAGDAAHAMHPLAGQGLNVGLADVMALSRVIQAKEFWRPLSDAKLLRRYERVRQAEVLAMGFVTDGLQMLFAQPDLPLQKLRNWGMTTFNQLSPLKKWMAAQAMKSSSQH
ncbi:MAG: ubiquinone biosynthesis protein UbiH [Limnohabitans sp.]|nr:ubiquinone biosynthesis protein UbiH [Limnohabitans sp.]